MSLRFIYGTSGTGKTTYCFNEISKLIEEDKKVYIITPEQFSFTAEKKLMETCKKNAVINAEVITFERMAYRIINEIGEINKKTISECGKAMLLYNIIDKQKENLNFLGKTDKNIELILRTITELKKNNIISNNLKNNIEKIEDKYTKIKLKDIELIYNEFNNAIINKFLDDNDLLTIIENKIIQSEMFKNSYIYIDEFAGFTKQEYKIIAQLLKCAQEVNITICTNNIEKNINNTNDIYNENKKTIEKLIKIAKENKIEIRNSIQLEEKYRFKNNELKYLEENIYAINPQKYLKENKNINLFLANNFYSEIEYIANNIIELVRDEKYRYRDISVITKNIEDYSNLIKSIFAQYNIPVFIDENKQLNQNILVKYILAILEIYAKNWNIEAICNYMKLGFIDEIEDEDIYLIENYCKKYGITGLKKFSNEWTITNNDNEDLDKLNKIKTKILLPLLKLKNETGKIKTVKEITKCLYKFLEENNTNKILNEKIKKLIENGQIDLANVYSESWNLVIDIFDELVLILGNEKISFEKYIELLKIGFNNSKLGKIPATLDEVIIGNVDRTRSSKKKVIFIIGLNDGKFPSVNKNEGFINDEERIYLREHGIELAKTTREQAIDEDFNIYKAFSTAEEKIFLSYSSSDKDGNGLRKSILINKIKKIFPNLIEKSDIIENKIYISSKKQTFDMLLINIRNYLDGKEINEIWFDIFKIYSNDEMYKEKLKSALKGIQYNNIAENIKQENLYKLYGDNLISSVSKLESYRKCPFSYYLKYALKLSDRTEFKLEKLDTGTLMHEIIDEFFEKIKEKNIKEIDEQEIDEIVEKILNEKLELKQNYIFNSSSKYIVLTKRLKKVLKKAIKYIVDTLKYSNFNVLGTEIEFGKNKQFAPIKIQLENNKSVEIIGKIDRIDIAENKEGKFIRIIDYKSSIKNIDLNEVISGIQIQLLTYVDAVSKKENAELAGTLYFNLIEPVIKAKNKRLTEEQIEQEIRNNFKMNGLILGNVEVVKMMDNKLTTGTSDIINAHIDKKGELSTGKPNILAKDEFKILQNKVEKIIKQISEEIMNGKIEQNPIYLSKNKVTACDYCKYKSICGFDAKICNNKYNYIPNLKKEEILYKLKNEK